MSYQYKILLPQHMFGVFCTSYMLMQWEWHYLLYVLAFNGLVYGIGVRVALNAYFSHKKFVTTKLGRQVLALLATLTCQNSIISWVSTHRACYHENSRPNGLAFYLPQHKNLWAGDLSRIRFVKAYHSNYTSIVWLYWLTLALVGITVPGADMVCSALVVATLIAFYQETLVVANRYSDTSPMKRNIAGLLTWGEGAMTYRISPVGKLKNAKVSCMCKLFAKHHPI